MLGRDRLAYRESGRSRALNQALNATLGEQLLAHNRPPASHFTQTATEHYLLWGPQGDGELATCGSAAELGAAEMMVRGLLLGLDRDEPEVGSCGGEIADAGLRG